MFFYYDDVPITWSVQNFKGYNHVWNKNKNSNNKLGDFQTNVAEQNIIRGSVIATYEGAHSWEFFIQT